jgi:hypothetical protein
MRIHWRLMGPLFALALVASAATAPCVLACSCVEPLPMAQSIDARTAVVVGQVGAPVAGRYPLVIERWFTGPAPAAVLTVEGAEQDLGGGQVVWNSCGRSFTPGQRLILVGEQNENLLATSLCSLGAEVASAEGQKLVADAERLFGPGTVPPGAPSDPDTAPEGGSNPGWIAAGLVGVAAVGLGGLVLAAAVLLARRREV